MKRTILLFSIVGALSILTLSSYHNGMIAGGGGLTPENRTGSPGQEGDEGCGLVGSGGCHIGGLASSINMNITLTDQENGLVVDSTWVPGHQYLVTLSGTSGDTSKYFGFQVGACNVDRSTGLANAFGSYTFLSGTGAFFDTGLGIYQGVKLIEQQVDLPAASPGSFHTAFYWTAPDSASSGTVDSVFFYAVMLPNNKNTDPSDDSSNIMAVPYGLKRGLFAEAVVNVLNNASITTYPNPVGDNLNISLTKAVPGLYTVNVYDVSGRRVLCQNYHVNSSTYNTSINTTSWTPGVYQVELLCGASHRTISIVK